jgi:hypothetical protein
MSRSARGVVRNRFFFLALLAGVSVLRLHYCLQLPVNTGDSVRHLCWGLIVNEHGYASMSKSLVHFSDNLAFVSWSYLPYNYPILSLLFDQVCAFVHPSLFSMKLLLTVIELVNAFLVLRYSRSRLLSFLYWASPISIWWVSHEGQFEPLQNLFILLSLLVFQRENHRGLAYFVLGLGVQVKLSAAFLLVHFVLSERRLLTLLRRGALFILAFVPSLLTFLVADPLELLARSAALRYNPYYFNFLDRGVFLWNPVWLIVSNELFTYGLLAALIVYGISKHTRQGWAELLPLILYLAFVKAVPNAQFWYMLSVMPLALLITDATFRRVLFLASPLLDVRSSVELLLGPFGWTELSYYKDFDSGVFTDIRSLF